MKKPSFILSLGVALSSQVALAATTIPERRTQDRYQKMPEDSPFALATIAVPVAAVVIPWASSFYVGGIGKSYVNGKEEVFVAIKSRGEQTAFSLFGNEAGFDGISVGGIEWNDSVGKSRVTLKKGPEFATVEFDQAVIQTPAAPVAQPRLPGIPGVPNANGPKTFLRPPGVSTGVPRPTAVPPQLPQAVPVPNPGGGSNTNSPDSGARPRVRVIKSNP